MKLLTILGTLVFFLPVFWSFWLTYSQRNRDRLSSRDGLLLLFLICTFGIVVFGIRKAFEEWLFFIPPEWGQFDIDGNRNELSTREAISYLLAPFYVIALMRIIYCMNKEPKNDEEIDATRRTDAFFLLVFFLPLIANIISIAILIFRKSGINLSNE